MTEPKIYQLSDFEPHVGKTFVLSLEGVEETAEAELIEASLCKGGKVPESAREPFALLFRLPAEAQIAQNTFTLTHEETGAISMFLVPIEAKEDGYFVEAVFN